jgi:RimJ/RimL family protein N-acetyltransferase
MARFIEPLVLEGRYARLVPLTDAHHEALARAAADGELWKLWFTSVPSPEGTAQYIATALEMRERLDAMPFVVERLSVGQIVGCTRYFNVDRLNRRLEIGHTWYAKSVQRSAINSECKLMLLRHAFEALDCIAVEFRTHWMNHASRAAIARLGAKQDGVLRNHAIGVDGTLRDTVVFSITASEWPTVRYALLRGLEREPC